MLNENILEFVYAIVGPLDSRNPFFDSTQSGDD